MLYYLSLLKVLQVFYNNISPFHLAYFNGFLWYQHMYLSLPLYYNYYPFSFFLPHFSFSRIPISFSLYPTIYLLHLFLSLSDVIIPFEIHKMKSDFLLHYALFCNAFASNRWNTKHLVKQNKTDGEYIKLKKTRVRNISNVICFIWTRHVRRIVARHDV